jgi:hypothetical protein
MIAFRRLLLFGIVLPVVCGFVLPQHRANAAEGDASSVVVMPERYISVKGDVAKFRAHRWMNDGHAAGLKDLSFKKTLSDGTVMEFDGHVIPDDNDHSSELSVFKKDLGALDIRYTVFRKYYDDSGGYYYPFTTLPTNDSGRDLKMDMGNFMVALRPDLDNLHNITLLYERHVKKGKKSRLTWAEVKEGATAKAIGPSWQEIDEVANVVTLQGETDIKGFDVSAEQRYEKVDTYALREEHWLATTGVAADTKRRIQEQRPESESWTSTFHGNKWFNDDTAFLGLAYRFHTLENSEVENITETDAAGSLFNFGSSAKNRVNATANNKLDAHTVTGNYSKNISPSFNVAAKFKTNYMKRKGESTYPYDAAPSNGAPDGTIEAIDYSDTRNTVFNYGQNFSFRYTGIQKTSIYGDVEIGRIHNKLQEEQHNISRVLTWERDTRAKTNKAVWTLGGRIIPSQYFNVSTQARHRLDRHDYDHQQDTSGSINSAFMDAMNISSDELTSKLTWKPWRWLQSSLRHQFTHKKFTTRVRDQEELESRTISNMFTYDVLLQPLDELLLNLSYSRQLMKTSTAATAQDNVQAMPGFRGDVDSILFSASYSPLQTLSFIGVAGYTFSDNFNDFTATGLPLAVANRSRLVELGLKYSPKGKDWSVAPHYGYYNYESGSISEYGDYNAHVGWLDFALEW